MTRLGALLMVLALSACVTAAPKQRIFKALPLEPEVWYELLYDGVQSCARKLGKASNIHYDDVEWYVIPHEAIPGIAGLYSRPNRIYLDEEYVLTEWVIAHESGHAAIVAGDNRHEDPIFKVCTQVMARP